MFDWIDFVYWPIAIASELLAFAKVPNAIVLVCNALELCPTAIELLLLENAAVPITIIFSSIPPANELAPIPIVIEFTADVLAETPNEIAEPALAWAPLPNAIPLICLAIVNSPIAIDENALAFALVPTATESRVPYDLDW